MRLNTKELINELVKPFNLKYEDLLGSYIEHAYIRQCLMYWLYHKHKYNYQDVADTFNITISCVFRAIEKLRKDKLMVEYNTKHL